jgi:DNA-binding Xre family transcriptional regulator
MDNNPEAMLGLRIMTLLHRQQKSVYALAKHAGLPVKTVQRICKGEGKQPSVWTIAAIARVLDVSIDELVGMLDATATAKQMPETSKVAPSAVKRPHARTAASKA